MTRILRLLWRCCWLTVAVGLIGLAVLLTLARLALPFASGYQDRIEAAVGDYLGVEVDAAEFDLEWYRLGPRLRLGDVAIAHPHGDVIRFEDAFARLSVLGGLQIRDVTLSGLDLEARIDADGDLHFWGFRVDPAQWREDPIGTLATADDGLATDRQADMDLVAGLLAVDRLLLLDARIRVTDADGNAHRIHLHELHLHNRRNRHRLALYAGLPTEWGRSVGLVVDARDLLTAAREPEADLYLRGDALAPARWQDLIPTDADRPRMVSGHADFELWTHWSGGAVADAVLRLEATDIRLARAEHAPVRADTLAGVFAWQRTEAGWNARARDLVVARDDRTWQSDGVAIERHGDRWRGRVDRVRLAGLADWAALAPGLDDHRELLAGLAPRGGIDNIAFSLTDAGAFRVHGQLRDLAWSAVNGWPGVSGLSGDLRVTPRGASLDLDSRGASFDHPAMFRERLHADRVEGSAHLERDGRGGWVLDVPALAADNPDLSTRTRLHLELPAEGSPWLDMQVDFADGNAAAKSPYLPVGIMFPALVDWLDEAIVDGHVPRGHALFHGRTRDFPFTDTPGVFEVDFEVENTRLAYAPEWPVLEDLDARLRFHGQALAIEARNARIYDSPIEQLSARFQDLTTGELEINAAGHPRMPDLIRLGSETPLQDQLGAFFEGAESDGGRAGMELRLDIPVQRADDTRIDGRLQLAGNRLTQPRFWLDLTNIHGEAAFTENSLTMDGVEADLHGQPVRIDALTRDQTLELRARGNLDIGAMRPAGNEHIGNRLLGAAPWDIRVDVGGQVDAGVPAETHVSARSSLVGTRIDLPAPFAKEAEAERPIRIDLPLRGERERHLLQARYGDDITLQAELDTSGEPAVRRGTLRFGPGRAELRDDPGWYLAGELAELVVDDWLELLPPADATAPGDRRGAATTLPGLSGAEMEFDRVRWRRHEVTTVDLLVERGNAGWDIDFASNEVTGDIHWPFAADAGRPLRGRFDWVDLDRLFARDGPGADDHPAMEADPGPHPADLPPLDLRVVRLTLAGFVLRDVGLVTAATGEGMTVHRLEAGNRHLSLTGQGQWNRREERDRSSVRLTLETSDFGAGLAELGVDDSGFVGGEGRITTELDWEDVPWSPDLASLSGNMRIRLDEGLITTVDPGPARLISLFSLQALPRRLALDFSSLFRRGFEYDRIRGRLNAADGNAWVTRMEMEGPPGRVRVSGRIGLIAEDFDQEIEFRPALTYSLPVIGVIVGGPVGGLTVTLLQQIMRGMGTDIESVAEVRYGLTGTWDEPKVERLRAELLVDPLQDATDSPTTTRPRMHR